MSALTHAAGIVNGVYPRPVAADSVIDLLAYNQESVATHISIDLVCGFHQGDQVAGMINGVSSNEYRPHGNTNEHKRSNNRFGFTVYNRYGWDVVAEVQSDNLAEFLVKMRQAGATGTLRVTYLSYPNGPKCYSEEEKTFRIIL